MNNYFGIKLNSLNYENRTGIYAVILNQSKEKLSIVRNGKGDFFLPGGGIEENESHFDCLNRELQEETGYSIRIGDYFGNAKRYFLSSNNEPLLNDGYFYSVKLLGKICEPVEDDHSIYWISLDTVEDILFNDHHTWAVKKYIK